MNVVVLGLFSGTQQGIDGAIYLMIGHGIVSGALFFCIGVLYDRYHSRLVKYYSGLTLVMPLFSVLFFVFTLANMGFPGTSNFVGELLIFIGLIQKNIVIMALSTTGVVLSAVYSIFLYSRTCSGQLKVKNIANFVDINVAEAKSLITLCVYAIFFGITTSILETTVSYDILV